MKACGIFASKAKLIEYPYFYFFKLLPFLRTQTCFSAESAFNYFIKISVLGKGGANDMSAPLVMLNFFKKYSISCGLKTPLEISSE